MPIIICSSCCIGINLTRHENDEIEITLHIANYKNIMNTRRLFASIAPPILRLFVRPFHLFFLAFQAINRDDIEWLVFVKKNLGNSPENEEDSKPMGRF